MHAFILYASSCNGTDNNFETVIGSRKKYELERLYRPPYWYLAAVGEQERLTAVDPVAGCLGCHQAMPSTEQLAVHSDTENKEVLVVTRKVLSASKIADSAVMYMDGMNKSGDWPLRARLT